MSTFVANLSARLAAARRLGPARTVVKAARLTRVLDVPVLRRWDVLHDEHIDEPGRMRQYLERYEAVAAAGAAWERLDFRDKRVLEIGCGPLGGWGPLAVFRGAASYTACDPVLDPAILRSPRFESAYLRPVFDHLAAHEPAARHDTADAFLAAWKERSVYVPASVDSLPPDARFDIVLSNSCLEHIERFEPFAKALAARLAPGWRMLHLVDFSNHRSKASPFRPLYDRSPEDYHRRYGPHINLLRWPEIVAALAKHGVELRCLPMDERPDLLRPDEIHPAWTARFDLTTLAVRTAVLIGTRTTDAGDSA